MDDLLEVQLRLAERYLAIIREAGRLEHVTKLNNAEEFLRNILMFSSHAVRPKLLLAELLAWRDSLIEALGLCEEIIKCSTFNQDALFQKATILIQMGNLDEAEEILKILQKTNPHPSIFQRYLAMCKFQTGRISEGWEDAKLAFNFSNLRLRYNNLTPWSGEDFGGKVLVISMLDVRGGGDEIMFSSALNRIIEKAKLCFIETDIRSFQLYSSSFRNSIVFVKGNEPWLEMGINVDFHIWSRELAPYFFSRSGDFPNQAGYLALNYKDQKYWDGKISNLAKGKKKIGICWTSLNRIGKSQPFTSSLLDWAPIFEIPNSIFINMHLLDGEEELRLAEKKLNIEIVSIAGADFLNRFDHIAGIAKACDLVITMATTTSNIAGSVGANVIEIRPSYTAICMDVLPWYPNHKRVFREWSQGYGEIMDSVFKLAQKSIN